MIKIEDVKPKDYQKFFPKPVTKNFLNFKEFFYTFVSFKNSFFLLILILLGLNVVAAPLNHNFENSKLAQGDLEKQKESLEAELKKVMQQIEEYKKTIRHIQSQKRNLQNELKATEAQIKKTELEIRAINLSIKRLNQRINETKKSIKITEEKINRSKEILIAALRYYYQLRQRNVIEVFLAEAKLSDYFNNFFYLQRLQDQINNELDNLQALNQKLNKEKIQLENELEEQSELLALSKIKYTELQDLKKQKQVLLAEASQQEAKYQELLEESEKTAAQIREQIYRLAGGGGAITFGQAYDLAKIAEKYTGIRPAFLLAVIHYESKLGQNVGTCHYKEAMKPSEQPLFEQIVKELGLDPDRMPVSCKPWYGWGGAMGPAQFLPSTWMRYRDRVSQITGNRPPSPWNNLDAFIAAALKLTDSGAASRIYQDEWKAAMIYFAGSNWSKPSLRFYGDDVMAIAEKFEKDIQILEKQR